ncbi:multicopper oxidase family protein [Streptomyces sp. NPDC086787]|uniref:multicopper oxidase family protein n=1 Tax=Streptomyces sp. NPDC086787 TaxID=3365759 RepID=UPI003803217A
MHTPSRRTLLRAPIAAVGMGIVAGCSESEPETTKTRPYFGSGNHTDTTGFVPEGPKGYVNPSGPEVRATERKRGSGPVRKHKFTASPVTVDLGGRRVHTWGYGDTLPGPTVRVTAGDILSLTLNNRLPATTTLHSHGVRLRCDMDGVPDLTQPPIQPGTDFTYRFAVSHPGTYLLHSHVGLQPDRGLYAPLIVDDPREPLHYDKEWVIVLDDWLDGVNGSDPDDVLSQLLPPGKHVTMEGMGMAMGGGHAGPNGSSGHSGPNRVLHNSYSRMLKSEGGSVAYPYYLINGRANMAPTVFQAKPGDRIRLRIINAGSETAFRVALGGHDMIVTHTDGYPIVHKRTDALIVGMAERYDVIVTAKDGVFPFVALAEGKSGQGVALLRTGKGRTVPSANVRPKELDGELVPGWRMRPAESVDLGHGKPDRELRLRLTGTMQKWDWGFDHEPYAVTQRHPIRQGERVRLTLSNATDMWHPLHLHGHTFALSGIWDAGARKDTSIVQPHRKLVVDFIADNPGLWMVHCHNQYHSESGMMTVLGYQD